jgi:hypothetical protein
VARAALHCLPIIIVNLLAFHLPRLPTCASKLAQIKDLVSVCNISYGRLSLPASDQWSGGGQKGLQVWKKGFSPGEGNRAASLFQRE